MALAFKLTRQSDDAAYVFLRPQNSSECQDWVRTDNPAIIFRRSADDSDWYCTTTADPSQRLGWHRGDGKSAFKASTGPPTGTWVSQKGDKAYEYLLEYLSPWSDLASEYELQDRCRNWDGMIQRLLTMYDGAHEPGSPKFSTFFDLGCGVGPISRRIAARGMSRSLISVDLDEMMVASTCMAIRAQTGLTTGLSVRLADLTNLTGKSVYLPASWKPAGDSRTPSVIWSSFCTAYFHSQGIGNVLRHWADTLLDECGLICLIEIQGLFSAHGLKADTETAELFQQADANILSSLQNDVMAGAKLEGIVRTQLSDVLEIRDSSEWDDEELAFEGAATQGCLDQWRKRMGRPGIARAVESLSAADGRPFPDVFLECLQSPDHTASRKLKMLILQKK